MFTAKDVMTTDVYTVQEDDTIRDVLNTFAARGISGAPIVNRQNHLKGYVSDGDIMRRLGRHQDPTRGYVGWVNAMSYYYGVVYNQDTDQQEVDEFRQNVRQLLDQSVQSVGTKKVITVQEDESMVNVAELLAHRNIKKVPVIRDKSIVGIISRGDIVRFVVQRFVQEDETQE